MQFVDISRYLNIGTPVRIPPYEELRHMKAVSVTQDLEIVQEPDNIEYLKSLAEKGVTVASIVRRPPHAKYVDRSSFPRRILLEMTSNCNFLCRMCPQQKLTRPRMDMPGGLYRSLIDHIDSHGVEGIWVV